MSDIKIIRISILPFHMVNAHLIQSSKGVVLVDVGLPGSEFKIEKALRKNGLTFRDIKLIIITHAHVDHAGAAYAIRELSKAPVLAHSDDAIYFNREKPMTFCPTGLAGKLFRKMPLIYEPYQAFVPDIMMSNNESIDLSYYGVAGRIRHTPGHTAGSISVELSTKDALVGDLIASGILIGGMIRKKHAIRPPFEDDPYSVGMELQHMLKNGMENFYMGHGGPLSAKEVKRHAQYLMSIGQPNNVLNMEYEA